MQPDTPSHAYEVGLEFGYFLSISFHLFACESMTMAKHPVQAVPFVYFPPVPNYNSNKGL